MKTDFLIVGTGFYGSVLGERISNILKKKVIFVEKRLHIGGNCYSEIDKKTQIEFHKYGTHIFHTSNENVWNYINNFTKFNNYKHQVLSVYKNKIYQMPINLETINSFFEKNFSPSAAENFIKKEALKEKIKNPKNFEEKAISLIGKKLYEAFFKEYTLKQWGGGENSPQNLPASIFNRLPIRFNYQEDYFKNSKYQGIPTKGYTEIFKNLLSSKNVSLILNTDYFKIKNDIQVKYFTIYTGPIDRYFNYKYGKLNWRSVRFKKESLNINDFQGNSVINYPEKKYKFTRIHEPKHLHPERNYNSNKTIIIKEYSLDDPLNPYYPINNQRNRIVLLKYKKDSKKVKNTIFGGRLADYAYYDMDMTISAALTKFNQLKKLIQ
jgi:UDP-galactopyranose mutase